MRAEEGLPSASQDLGSTARCPEHRSSPSPPSSSLPDLLPSLSSFSSRSSSIFPFFLPFKSVLLGTGRRQDYPQGAPDLPQHSEEQVHDCIPAPSANSVKAPRVKELCFKGGLKTTATMTTETVNPVMCLQSLILLSLLQRS